MGKNPAGGFRLFEGVNDDQRTFSRPARGEVGHIAAAALSAFYQPVARIQCLASLADLEIEARLAYSRGISDRSQRIAGGDTIAHAMSLSPRFQRKCSA